MKNSRPANTVPSGALIALWLVAILEAIAILTLADILFSC